MAEVIGLRTVRTWWDLRRPGAPLVEVEGRIVDRDGTAVPEYRFGPQDEWKALGRGESLLVHAEQEEVRG